jgi:hypothetical protein
LFSRVFGERFTAGVRVGLVVAAATAGLLVGFGLRQETVFTTFLLYGRAVSVALTGRIATDLVAALAGITTHALWMVLWGLCFTVVAAPLRNSRLAVAAAAFTALAALVAVSIFPAALGAITRASLTKPQTVLVFCSMAIALFAGIRLARP